MLEKEGCIYYQYWNQYEQCNELCIALPRAIASSDGQLVNCTKSSITNVFEEQYENAVPTTVIEGIILINITSWSAHCNVGGCAEFLLRQHILPHFRNGSNEEHLLFDEPECQERRPYLTTVV